MLSKIIFWFLIILPPTGIMLSVCAICVVKINGLVISDYYWTQNIVMRIICVIGTISSFVLYVFPK